MIPYGFETAVFSTTDERIGAVLVWIVKSKELILGHILRIETGSGGLFAITGQERFPGETVPRTIVDFSIKFRRWILERCKEGLSVSEILLPINVVNFIGCQAVKSKYFLPVVGDAGQIRRGNGHQGVIIHQTAHIYPFLHTGNGDQGDQGP